MIEFLLGMLMLFQIVQFFILVGIVGTHNKIQERMNEIDKTTIAETARKYFRHLSTH